MDAVRSALRLGAQDGQYSLSPHRNRDARPCGRSPSRQGRRRSLRDAGEPGGVPRRREGQPHGRDVAAARNWASRTTQDAAARCRSKARSSYVPCQVAIIAAGTTANPLIQSTTPGLAATKRGYISANDDTLGDLEAGRLCRRRHRHRRRDRDPGHGRGTQGSQSHQRVSEFKWSRQSRQHRPWPTKQPRYHNDELVRLR